MTERRKLIEVALPLEAINRASAREKTIAHGHPSTLHLWWARRPLAACRAVLFASLVDDPSCRPEEFPTEEDQERERQRLFRIIEELVKWENSAEHTRLEAARAEIRRATNGDPPLLLDPFSGGGSIPLEAQRLGLEAHASDLNPVAVLITKALVELPPAFAGRPPVNPDSRQRLQEEDAWRGAQGLAEDVHYYGEWMREEAERRIGHLYPEAHRPDGRQAAVIAWLWARTVICPNPACGATMPLLNSFVVARRGKRHFSLRPQVDVDRGHVGFTVHPGATGAGAGSIQRSGATCLVCRERIPLAYVRSEGRAGRMGVQLVCTVAEGDRRRLYLSADRDQQRAAEVPEPPDSPSTSLPEQALGFRVQAYGLTQHRHLFTGRQLTALGTFSDLVRAAHERLLVDGADRAYARAVATYLTLAVGRLANRSSSQCFCDPGGEKVQQVFARNALPMIWVFAEANPFSSSSGNFLGQVGYLSNALRALPAFRPGIAEQRDATAVDAGGSALVVTDPPYYDNVPYADLSDFFYVWLRRAGAFLDPHLFSTLLVPKSGELIADPSRHANTREAARYFEDGLRRVFARVHASQEPNLPFVFFYAFRQSEDNGGDGRVSTGWETMLQGLMEIGYTVTGTWPLRTEQPAGLRELRRNALASSIALVCRRRGSDVEMATRREFVSALRTELPDALRTLQYGNIAPVDLAQAAIGPGMAVFSRYSKVIEADGSSMTVRTALSLINQALDEILVEQEGNFDADTRFAVTWFEQRGMAEGPYGEADVLARAKNTSVAGMEQAQVLTARGGKVRLLSRDELSDGWDPVTDRRPTAWEAAQHLTRRLEAHGEDAAAGLLRRLSSDYGEQAKELAYRLFSICERKGWAQEAIGYNALVVAWPEIARRVAGTPEAEAQEALEV